MFVPAGIGIVIAACSSSSGSPDTTVGDSGPADGHVAIDSGLPSDANASDGTNAGDTATATDSPGASDASDAAISCPYDFGSFSLSGAPGTTQLLVIGSAGRDGIVARVTENGADIELSDIEAASSGIAANAIAVGAGGIHSITGAAAPAPYTAARLGDAPGITALARDGTMHFGAGGLAFSIITTTPFAVTAIGTLTPPAGCTKVVDFVATNSTVTGGIFLVTLDCGSTSRIKEYTWSSSSSTLTEVAVFDITGPAGPVGMGLNSMTTADGKLYQTSGLGSGSITFLRNLTPCIGFPTRGMQE
jgi:hypothetical protein